jgi:cytochrome c oxidase cbb3-type subunit 3
MDLFKPRYVSLSLLIALAAVAAAQEPPMAPGRGRGGRDNMREFLGLGPAPDAEAAKLGDPVYKQNCGTCHGENGRGSQGPNLVRSTVILHDVKGEEIGPVIKNGRPQAGMPAFAELKPEDIYNISQYLHMQVELAANRGLYGATYSNRPNQTSGDPLKGKTYFEANCSSCHSVTGAFAKIGAKFPQAVSMQSRFLWPVHQGPLKATVTAKDGQTFTGSLMKLDDFNVSLRVANGDLRQWPLDRVKVKVEDNLGGHRALLPKYTDADIHNITAYLVTLK